MGRNKEKTDEKQLRLIYQELKENPYQKFNYAFALMSIIPFLVFFYLLSVKLFTINILVGNVGLVLFISIIMALCGSFLVYHLLRNILKSILNYAARAKRSDEQKSTFVATVAHDLTSPLSIIKMNVFSLHSGFFGKINEKQQHILATCNNILERMSRLINDLLDIYKFEAKVVTMRRTLCNIADLIEKQVQELELMLRKKGLKLNKKISHEDLSAWGDENKINQVINNLITNAVKYTPEGGEITISLSLADEFVKFECINTGPGLPKEKADKIFDKFERVDYTKEGSGLGLAIAKDIVELHGGKIWVESEPGKGCNFIVVLPCDLRKGRR